MNNQIDIKNLTIGYKEQAPLITNQNLQLSQGEFVALVGKNGSGKSSLLRTVANFQPLQKGQIFINNKKHEELSAPDFAKLVSVVLTDKVVMGYTTVFDVVAAGRFPYLGLYGNLKEEDKSVVSKSLELVGMGKYANKPFDNLSDGQQQKVILAKALAQETPYILLDEPMAFLDLPSKMELSHILHDLAKNQGKGILISTHDLDLAIHTCDTMWLLSQQQIMVGMPEDLALKGLLGEVFNTNKVSFNAKSGHFEFESKKEKQVKVINIDSLDQFWLSKALHRNGYKVSSDALMTITKKENYWEIQHADKLVIANNLKELIALLP